jgi:CRISPR-associated protein, csd1 family
MDFFTTLLNSYEKAEEQGLVDDQSQDTILLPIYHTDHKSTGTDTVVVELTPTGDLISAYEMPKGQRIMYPVTEESVRRVGDKTPHPLTDKLEYYLPAYKAKKKKKYQEKCTFINEWLAYETDTDIHTFITAIQNFLNQPDFDKQLSQKLYNDAEQLIKIDTYIEFAIPNFKNYKTYSVSNYQKLHQSYINFVNNYNKKNYPDNYKKCIISGKEDLIISKHRGAIGNAKLISISANDNRKEMFAGSYFGTSSKTTDIVKIGYQTSEKIHLMLNYLCNNRNSCYRIDQSKSNPTYLLIWKDISTSSPDDISVTNNLLSTLGISPTKKEDSITPNRKSRAILNSFYTGQEKLTDDNYYIAIIRKSSDGRSSLNYFETIKKSQLFENLQKWNKTYQWTITTKNGDITITPSFFSIINDAFAQDHGGEYLELSKGLSTYRAQLHECLLSALLNGQPIPTHILKRIEQNLKYPKRYPKQWNHLVRQGLALLNRKDYQPMIDNSETDRSYLFGRLLAVYERIEATKYSLDDNNSSRETNAQRLWTTCINRPDRILKNLKDKVKPYNDYLYRKHRGLWTKFNKEEGDILTLLDTHRKSPDFNKPLTTDYLFGYQAEKNYLFTSSKQTESEK